MGRKHWYERERQEPRGGTRELFRVREGRPLGREKTDRPTGKGVVGKKGRRQRAEGESEEVTKMGRKETKEREKEKRNEETTKRGEEKGRKGGKKEWERRRGRGAVRPRGRGKRGERERKRETVSSTRRAAGAGGWDHALSLFFLFLGWAADLRRDNPAKPPAPRPSEGPQLYKYRGWGSGAAAQGSATPEKALLSLAN